MIVKALPRICAPLIPICLDWKTCGCSVTLVYWQPRDSRVGEARNARGTVALVETHAGPVHVKIPGRRRRRQDRIPFDVALHHTETQLQRQLPRKKKHQRATFFLSQRHVLDFFPEHKAHLCLPTGRFINSKSKRNFVSIVTVRAPLWKVFSVVTKTTIQRWHTSMARSWLDEASARSLHKQAPRQKTKKNGGR